MIRRRDLGALLSVPPAPVVVLISANAEWRAVREERKPPRVDPTPFGESFTEGGIVFLHGGWGKIAAAASTQYAIDRWSPRALINLGTCGGIAGRVERYALVMAERTLVYDIAERMGSAQEALDHYTTDLNPPRVSFDVLRTTLLSADQDLDPSAISALVGKYGARVVDWESGAIAYVAARNRTRLVVLRGVSDLVSARGGQAYGNEAEFANGTLEVMRRLLAVLPDLLRAL